MGFCGDLCGSTPHLENCHINQSIRSPVHGKGDVWRTYRGGNLGMHLVSVTVKEHHTQNIMKDPNSSDIAIWNMNATLS